METVRYPVRNQWIGTMTCPACHQVVRAWRSSGMSECFPHFYCDRCSNAIHRLADQKLVYDAPASSEILERIAATLPHCSCGGHFKPGANPKCPACGAEFPHQNNALGRLTDPHLILVHGACLFSDERPPYRVEIDEPPVA